jgi:hypothetical protein
MCATKLNLLDGPVANFQSFISCPATVHKLCCTDDQSFRNAKPQNKIVWFWRSELPKGDVEDLRPAQLVKILWLQDGLRKRCIVLLWKLQLENQGIFQPSNGQLKVSNKDFSQN